MSAIPPIGIKTQLQPWETIAWPLDRQKNMFTDWGTYFAKKQFRAASLKYFQKALEIQHQDPKVLHKICIGHRNIGAPITALSEARLAAKYFENLNNGKKDAQINMEICDALYESNQFETCQVELVNNKRIFSYTKGQSFANLENVLNANFEDTLGFKHATAVKNLILSTSVSRTIEETKKPECDVVSILEEQEKLLSPLEHARRKRAFEIYNQTYLNHSWIDVNFLKMLRQNPYLLQPENKLSTEFLNNLTAECYECVSKFTKMLHARSPLYNCHHEKFPNKSIFNEHHENNLFRIQYQTRRNMLKILNSIRILRKSNNVEKLINFVEDVMGKYVSIKTYRVMPWKFEFMCEVYNQLALALIQPYIREIDPKTIDAHDRLMKLLQLPTDKHKDRPTNFIFGDRSTHQNAEIIDPKTVQYKKLITHLEHRLKFAKYSIERCYLMHEISRAHLNNNAFDACCFVGRNAILEADKSNVKIWAFLILMLSTKAHAILGKIEQCHNKLKEARIVAEKLRSPELCTFTEICLKVNVDDWERKKISKFQERPRQRRSQIRSPSSTTTMSNAR